MALVSTLLIAAGLADLLFATWLLRTRPRDVDPAPVSTVATEPVPRSLEPGSLAPQ